jgi:lysophospholipase L1-like esterase
MPFTLPSHIAPGSLEALNRRLEYDASLPALNRQIRPGIPTFGVFGTSISDQGARQVLPPASTPSSAYFADGYQTWLRILSFQRVNIPLGLNFGVSGNKFSDMLARVDTAIAAMVAANTDFVLFEGGTNDFPVETFAAMKANWLALLDKFYAAGIIPIIIPAPPRGGSLLTTAQLQTQMRFTEYQRNYCINNRLLFVDYLPYLVDQTTATSTPVASMIKADNVHPATPGGFWIARSILDGIAPWLPGVPSSFMSNASIYSADNPTGNLLYTGTTNKGLLAGTGGTQTASTGLTHAGSLATYLQAIRSGSSTATWTHAKENPRTDTVRGNGERQLSTLSGATGGASDEVYNYRMSPALADIAVGDWYYAEAAVQMIAAPTQMWALELYMLESRPSNSQTAIDLGLRDFSHGMMPPVAWSGLLRTPPIQRTSDATAVQANVRARHQANNGSFGHQIAVGDFRVCKLEAA